MLESPIYGSRRHIKIFSLTISRLYVLPSTAQYVRPHVPSFPRVFYLFLCCQEHNTTTASSFPLFQIPHILTFLYISTYLHLLTSMHKLSISYSPCCFFDITPLVFPCSLAYSYHAHTQYNFVAGKEKQHFIQVQLALRNMWLRMARNCL